MSETLQEQPFLTEEIGTLQADFERVMTEPTYESTANQLAYVLKHHDQEIEAAERLVRQHQREREYPLGKYEKKLADFAATLPDKDPFYAASFYMDARFDGTWESHSRNSGDMLEYWHERGMLLASLNALLLRDVQPVFMLDVATSEMGGERSQPLSAVERYRGGVKNKFIAVVGHSSPSQPMEIVDEVELDATTGARTLRPSKVMLNVEIDDMIVSPNWPTHNMGGKVPKAGIRKFNDEGVLQVPILEAPFPSIGFAANVHLVTEIGGTSIFGTTDVAVGAERSTRLLWAQKERYVNDINYDELTWGYILRAVEANGLL